jgi:hypothetical protein
MAISLSSFFPLYLTAQADGLLPPKLPSETAIPVTAEQTAPNLPVAQPAAPLSAMVIQQPFLSETDAQGLIQVITSPIPFESRLQRTYQGYRITVQSDYPGILHVQSASINNGQNGTMAFETVRSSMTLVYASLFLGLAGFLLIGVPVLLVKNHRNDKTRTEALPFTNQIPLLDLAKGQTLHFDALVPLGQKPDISLSFLDRKSGLLFTKRAVQ